jgi:hypothetical protein
MIALANPPQETRRQATRREQGTRKRTHGPLLLYDLFTQIAKVLDRADDLDYYAESIDKRPEIQRRMVNDLRRELRTLRKILRSNKV